MRVLALLAVLLVALPLAPAAPPPNPVPQAAAGFTVTPLVPLAAPTAIEFGPGDADGPDLYATTLSGDVARVWLRWTSAGPVAERLTTRASGFSQPLGLAFHGDALLVADSHPGAESGRTDGRVTRVDANGSRTVIVDGLPNGRHNTNHLRFGPDGRLGITNGNPNDAGPNGGAADVFPYSGALLSVDVDQVTASPAVLRWKNGTSPIHPSDIAASPLNAGFASKVQVIGSGFRNVFGLAWSPAGVAYTAMNGADDPSSQDALFKVSPGANYTFPYCFNVGAPGATGAGVTTEPNPLFPTASCAGVPKATALLGWHVCATGLDFPTAGPAAFSGQFRTSVYVAECGPFFPEPTEKGFSTHDTGHKVVQVVLDANGDAVEVRDFLTGLALPTDVRFGPDGAMYVADAGMVYRIAPVPLPAPTVTVLAAGVAFASPVTVIPAGGTVEWQGALLSHTVTTSDDLDGARAGIPNDPDGSDGNPDTFDAGLVQGGTFSHTFETPGVYTYYCAFHYQLGMVGTVVVV